MKTQLKYEVYKLWKRRFVFLSFIILIFFCILRFQYFETADTKQQVKQTQAILEPLNGVVDEQFGQTLEDFISSYKMSHPTKDEQVLYEQNTMFVDPSSIFLYYGNYLQVYDHVTTMKSSALKDRYLATLTSHDFVYSSQGSNWAKTIYFLDLESYYCIFLCIIIACSTIFSHDRECHVEELLLTTKEGRRNSIKAKLGCAFLITLCAWLIFTLIPLGLHYLNYGFGGYEATLSLYELYNSVFPYTMMVMLGWRTLLSLLGVMLFTMITLLISRKTNSMLAAALLSIALFAVPIILLDTPGLGTLAYLTPSFTARLKTSFDSLLGFQMGTIVLLKHELFIIINTTLLVIFSMIFYHNAHTTKTKRRIPYVRSHQS